MLFFDYAVLDIFLALAVGSLLLAAFINRRHRRELLSLCLALSILLHLFSLFMMSFADLPQQNPAPALRPKHEVIALKVGTQRQKESIARQRLRAELPRHETADRHAGMQTAKIELPQPLRETRAIRSPMPAADTSPRAANMDFKQPVSDAPQQTFDAILKPTDAPDVDAFEIKMPAKPVAVETPLHDDAAPNPMERIDGDRATPTPEPIAPNAAPKPRMEQELAAQSPIAPQIETIATKARAPELKDSIETPKAGPAPDRIEIRANALEQAKENNTAHALAPRPSFEIKQDKSHAAEQAIPEQARHPAALPAALPQQEAKSAAVEAPDGIERKQTFMPEQTAAAKPSIQPPSPALMGSAPKMLDPFVGARPEISREPQDARREIAAQKEKQFAAQPLATNVKPPAPFGGADRSEELHSTKIEKISRVAIDSRRPGFIRDKIASPLHEDASLAAPMPSASAAALPSERSKPSSNADAAPAALAAAKQGSFRETTPLPEQPASSKIQTAMGQGAVAVVHASTLAGQLGRPAPAPAAQAPAPQEPISQTCKPAGNAVFFEPAVLAGPVREISRPAFDAGQDATINQPEPIQLAALPKAQIKIPAVHSEAEDALLRRDAPFVSSPRPDGNASLAPQPNGMAVSGSAFQAMPNQEQIAAPSPRGNAAMLSGPAASVVYAPSHIQASDKTEHSEPAAFSTAKQGSFHETAFLPEQPASSKIQTAMGQGVVAHASTLAGQLGRPAPAPAAQAPAPQEPISHARKPAENADAFAPAVAAGFAQGITKPAVAGGTGAIAGDSQALAISKIAVADAPALNSRPPGTAMENMRADPSAERAPGRLQSFSDAEFSMPRSAPEIPVEISKQPFTRLLLSAENAPELRFAPEKAIYKMRKPERRKQFIETLGGTTLTEEAVENALQWLGRTQSDDGRWDVDGFKTLDECGGAGDLAGEDVAVTGLALLAFLGAGYTHLEGIHKDTVLKGLEWLLNSEEENGDFRGTGKMYGQAIATVVLCEAYSLTADKRLLASAERSVRFIVNAQVPGSGWQYGPSDSSDTSVTGWQILALKSASIAGIAVPEQTFKWTQQWLDHVRQGKEGGLYSSRPMHPVTRVMTAEGLFCQLFMNEQTRARGQKESIAYINSEPPRWDEKSNAIHMYYWYYAILSLYLSGADEFKTWNDALTTALLQGQKKNGPAAGSWDPVGQLGPRGGRVYSTAIAALCLEVYYRFLPLYMRDSD